MKADPVFHPKFRGGLPMRLVIASLIAATSLFGAACSNAAAPGSPEWCKNTPPDKQIEDPTAMGKCLENATK
jgi:hypothetical protein